MCNADNRAARYPAEPSIVEPRHHHLRARIFFQKVSSMFDQLLARLCQVGAFAETFHEGHLEAPFEFLHLMRHGRLR
jgi:hypothetical protein